MSDDAVVWKLGFGVLVLVLCGVLWVARSGPREAAPQSEVAPAVTAPVAHPPAASPPPEVQDDPTPIEAVIEDEPAPAPAARAPRKAKRRPAPAPAAVPVRATHFVPLRIHRVVATRRTWAKAGPHYPFDPRQRWASRELP